MFIYIVVNDVNLVVLTFYSHRKRHVWMSHDVNAFSHLDVGDYVKENTMGMRRACDVIN